MFRAPGERFGALAVVEVRRDVARRLREDPAIVELIDTCARRHPGGKLAAGAGRRLAARALEQQLD
jgi:hypothetical protein